MSVCFDQGDSKCDRESTNCDGKCTAGNPWMRPIYGQVHHAPPEFEIEIAGVRKGLAPHGYQLPRYVEIGPPEGEIGPDGGTFTLTMDGKTTGAIDYDADHEDVQIALLAVCDPIVGGPLAVYGDAGGPWIVAFADALAVSSLTVDEAGLTGGVLTATPVRDMAERVNGNYSGDMLLTWHGWYQPVWELFSPASWWTGTLPLRWLVPAGGTEQLHAIDLEMSVVVDSTDAKRYAWVIVFALYYTANNLDIPPTLYRRVFRHAWRKEIPFSKNVAELQDFALDHRDKQCESPYPGLDNNYLDWSNATCKITAKLP